MTESITQIKSEIYSKLESCISFCVVSLIFSNLKKKIGIVLNEVIN